MIYHSVACFVRITVSAKIVTVPRHERFVEALIVFPFSRFVLFAISVYYDTDQGERYK
jgi:hypothetical protein